MSTRGIPSALHARFALVLGLHALAWLLLTETGSPAPLVLAQGLAAAAISFVVVSTVAWQWQVLGDPREPHNLVGHLAAFVSVMLLVGRLYVRDPGAHSLLDLVADSAQWAADALGIVPASLFDVLRSPGVVVLFVAVCLALSFRRAIAVGLLVSVGFLAVALAVFRDGFTGHGWFLGGLAALATALWLQYDGAADRTFWRGVRRRLGDDPARRGDLELEVRLLERLHAEGRALTARECASTVARAVDRSPEDPAVHLATARVVARLRDADGIAEVRHDAEGEVLALRPDLAGVGPDAFGMVAVIPRTVVVVGLVLFWVVMPLDPLPDALPFLGALDDVLASLLGVRVVADAVATVRSGRRGGREGFGAGPGPGGGPDRPALTGGG